MAITVLNCQELWRGFSMQGIYIINEQINIKDLSRDESIEIQKQALLDYIQEKRMEPVKLNPYQLNTHYTIPHALLYDLRVHKRQFDCLLIYSKDSIEDFAATYPARWLILKSYFDRILTVV
jgi:ubiquinone biosynthesis protein COQ9